MQINLLLLNLDQDICDLIMMIIIHYRVIIGEVQHIWPWENLKMHWRIFNRYRIAKFILDILKKIVYLFTYKWLLLAFVS